MERSASGPTWAIATPHEEATRAGAAAFEGGGNAVDAALRAATVLAVVYPHMCGVGGDPGLSAIFFADGIPSPAGATVYQPALGATLAGIAEGGPEALYGGDIGRAYVRGLSGAGSPITIEDLSAHRALVLPPIAAA